MKKRLFAITAIALGAAVCTPIVLATPQSTCSSSKTQAVQTAQSSCSSSCSSAKAVPAVASKAGCPTTTAMRSLVAALYQMDQADGPSAGEQQVLVALAALAEANPQITAKMTQSSDKSASVFKLASVKKSSTCSSTASSCSSSTNAALVKNDATSSCSSAATLTAAAPAASTCSSQAKTKASCSGGANANLVSVGTCGTGAAPISTATLVANSGGCCNAKQGAANAAVVSNSECSSGKAASECCKTKKGAVNAAVVSNSECSSGKAASECCKTKKGVANAAVVSNAKCSESKSECKTAANASFVAFGCDKSDSIARTAAQGYLHILVAMKKASGADGCPMDMAQKTLAAVIDDMGAERRAQAPAGEVQAVSLGVKVDPNCSAECQAICKKLGIDCTTTAKN